MRRNSITAWVWPARLGICVLALLTSMLVTGAEAKSWRSVQSASQLEFIATYEGEEIRGRFLNFTVALQLDPRDVVSASLQVDVDIASASMGNSDTERELGEPQWFNTRAFPQAEFRSTHIRDLGDSNYVAQGLVKIKGVQRGVAVPFRLQAEDQTANMRGALSLSRADFGIGSGEWAQPATIGHEVMLRFALVMEALP